MMKIGLMLLAFLAMAPCECTSPDPFPLGVHLHGIAPPELAVEWQTNIIVAANRWNQVLGDFCPDPFKASTGGYPLRYVRLIPIATWPHGDKVIGFYDGETIDIKEQAGDDPIIGMQPILMHELMHAIGVHEHLPDKDSAGNSINLEHVIRASPKAFIPSFYDVGHARDALDCN